MLHLETSYHFDSSQEKVTFRRLPLGLRSNCDEDSVLENLIFFSIWKKTKSDQAKLDVFHHLRNALGASPAVLRSRGGQFKTPSLSLGLVHGRERLEAQGDGLHHPLPLLLLLLHLRWFGEAASESLRGRLVWFHRHGTFHGDRRAGDGGGFWHFWGRRPWERRWQGCPRSRGWAWS